MATADSNAFCALADFTTSFHVLAIVPVIVELVAVKGGVSSKPGLGVEALCGRWELGDGLVAGGGIEEGEERAVIPLVVEFVRTLVVKVGNDRIVGMRKNRWRISDGIGCVHRGLRVSGDVEWSMLRKCCYMLLLLEWERAGGNMWTKSIS